MRKSGMVQESMITKGTGNTREWSEIDTNEYLTGKKESDQAARGQVQQGYKKVMTAYEVAENIGISSQMRRHNKYPEVIRRLTSGGAKGEKTMDLDLSHRITFGTATSYTNRDGETISITTGDALQLFYSAHLLNGSTATYRNRLANNPKISKGAIEGMERLVTEETYNELGEKMVVAFDILYTTDDSNSKNTARQYIGSKSDPEAAHAGVVNPIQGTYRHVILPRVATTAAGAPDSTKRYYWGIASSELSCFYLGIWMSPYMIPPTANSNGEDVQTDDWDFRVRAEYGIAIPGAKWIKFSSGDGEA